MPLERADGFGVGLAFTATPLVVVAPRSGQADLGIGDIAMVFSSHFSNNLLFQAGERAKWIDPSPMRLTTSRSP